MSPRPDGAAVAYRAGTRKPWRSVRARRRLRAGIAATRKKNDSETAPPSHFSHRNSPLRPYPLHAVTVSVGMWGSSCYLHRIMSLRASRLHAVTVSVTPTGRIHTRARVLLLTATTTTTTTTRNQQRLRPVCFSIELIKPLISSLMIMFT